MAIRLEDHTPCKNGCGKLVINASGICLPCRRTKCSACGKTFSANVPGIKQCGDCKSARTRKERVWGSA